MINPAFHTMYRRNADGTFSPDQSGTWIPSPDPTGFYSIPDRQIFRPATAGAATIPVVKLTDGRYDADLQGERPTRWMMPTDALTPTFGQA